MINAFTAYTNEIDDVDQAIEELLGQLALEGRLLENAVGIVSCYSEYIDSGVVRELCARLPFDVVGATTIANAVPGEIGEMMLALMVLTGDKTKFAVGLTDPIPGEVEKPILKAYQETAAALPGRPELILSFAPLLMNVGGDFYVNVFDKASGGVPNFGTLAVDHNEDYREAQVIFKGEAYRDRYAFILMQGEVDPACYMGAISDEKVFSEKGAVTASAGNQLQTVNGIPMIDYLLSIGLTKNEEGTITGINSFPIIVDYNDGTPPVARAMFALTPQGFAVCGGDIPVGASLSIGEFDSAEIRDTTKRTLQRALRESGKKILLMYSCVGRYFSQGANRTIEVEGITGMLKEAGVPYLFAYSGGEMCPVYGREGAISNRNHNNTFVICAI